MSITIERITEITGCEACHEVASRVWGEEAACSVPQMLVHAVYGGVVLLARDNELPVGFVFSFPALYHGNWVLWSHETAVLPEYLHQGIGTKLKMEQWRIGAKMPFYAVAWTFDPLVSRNAHFNLNKLHARISEYKVNAYGIMEDLINGKLETDRFITIWPFQNEDHVDQMEESQMEELVAEQIVVLGFDKQFSQTDYSTPMPKSLSLPTWDLCSSGQNLERVVETRIPLDMEKVFRESFSVSSAWRKAFREAALKLFDGGFRVVRFERREKYGVYIWKQSY